MQPTAATVQHHAEGMATIQALHISPCIIPDTCVSVLVVGCYCIHGCTLFQEQAWANQAQLVPKLVWG